MIEKIVGILIPPACREEVLGDLHERYTSTGLYILEALHVIPMVLFSRIRRTADAQVVLAEFLALCLSFVVGGYYQDRAFSFLFRDGGLMSVALPCALVLVCLVLDDAYAMPGRRSPLKAMRGLVLGLVAASISQAWLSAMGSSLALPRSILLYASPIALLLISAVRILFPPVADRPLGASGPAYWLKQDGGSSGTARAAIEVFKSIGMIVLVAFLGTWMGGPALGRPVIVFAAMILVVREVIRRG